MYIGKKHVSSDDWLKQPMYDIFKNMVRNTDIYCGKLIKTSSFLIKDFKLKSL